MKKLLLLSCLLSFITSMVLALPIKPIQENTSVVSTKAAKKAIKKQVKFDKKKAKLGKRIQKLERKLAKRGIERTEASGVWNDDTFKLGALVALGGLLLTILGVLPILGGIFSLIGGLMMIVGVGLMIWVLIESY